MKLRRVHIAGFRGLTGPIEVADLEDGLNVIGGDNEAGKSTWLEAVRTALFDRHTLTGKVAESLQPDGQRIGPEIELTFDVDGGTWQLAKRFCQRPAAELTGPGGERHTADAAEDRLQQLLGFERPGRGASESKHHGVFGLLWLTQGSAHLETRPPDAARRALGGALEAEVGDVLGGGLGQQLLDDLAAERDRYWTERTGKPARDLKRALDEVAALAAEHAEARVALEAYRRDVVELGRAAEDHRRLRERGELERLRARRDTAREAHAQLAAARSRETETATELRIAAAEAGAAENRWSERRDLLRQQQQASEALAGQAPDRAARQAQRSDCEQQLTAARERREACRRARSTAEAAVAARDRHRRRKAKAAERERLRQTLEQARAAESERQRALREAASITVTAKSLKRLRAIAEKLSLQESRLDAGATWLSADVNVPVHAEGAARGTAGGYRIIGEARLRLEGIGTITVTPGGTDLATAERERDRLMDELERHYRELGVPTVADAETRLADRKIRESRAHTAEAQLQILAPDGVEALSTSFEAVEAELSALGDEPEPSLEQHPEQTLTLAIEELAAAEQALDERQHALAALRERFAAEESRQQAREDEHRRLGERLTLARAEAGDDALHEAALAAGKRLTAAREAGNEAERAVKALNPERIELQLESAEAALQQTSDDLVALEKRCGELRVRLDALGHDGLSERAEALEAELARAVRQRDAVQREADAVWHAWSALDAAARSARETFLGPLTARLRPYLDLLLPEAELTLDDGLGLTGLRRNGHEEPFGQLSVGTREQLAIVTRLAFADLLAEHGDAVPVILDDALVFADDDRFEAMQLILRRAARRHQVIILTCRPRTYRDLGAPVRRLGKR